MLTPVQQKMTKLALIQPQASNFFRKHMGTSLRFCIYSCERTCVYGHMCIHIYTSVIFVNVHSETHLYVNTNPPTSD